MRKIFFSLILAGSLFSCKEAAETKVESSNPNQHLVMATLWYQRASECRALYYQAYNAAKLSLDQQLQNSKSKKAKAVVVDIDETVLDNSPFEVNSIRTGKSYSSKAWKTWTDMAKATATPGSLGFLNYAKSQGVETFYISNRDTSATSSSLKNLQALGFPFADKDHLLLKTNTSVKTARRNQVLKTHEILILCGDNIGDFDELLEDRSENYGFAKIDSLKDQFGKRFIVLPNPMYGGWERQVLKSDTKLNNQEKEALRIKKMIGYEEL